MLKYKKDWQKHIDVKL